MQRMAMVNGLRIAYDESGAGDLARRGGSQCRRR